MAISLSDLRRVKADQPPRILLYGVPKIGKTTLASEFPNPVFIQAEDGTPGGVELVTFGKVNTLQQVWDAFEALDSPDHDFQTLVIDSLSALEHIVNADICERNKWQSIESPGYGKGFIETDLAWLRLMSSISYLRRERNMIVLLLAHSEIKHIEDPINGPYDRFQIQLHKRAMDIVNKEVDIIAFLNYQMGISEQIGVGGKKIRKAVGVGKRVMHFADRPSFIAGDRYDFPDEIPYEQGKGFDAIAPFLPGTPSIALAPAEKEAA